MLISSSGLLELIYFCKGQEASIVKRNQMVETSLMGEQDQGCHGVGKQTPTGRVRRFDFLMIQNFLSMKDQL